MRSALALVLLLLCQERDPAADLVDLLDGNDIAVRDDAQRRLRAMGPKALAALKKAPKSAETDALIADLERQAAEAKHDADERHRQFPDGSPADDLGLAFESKPHGAGRVITTRTSRELRWSVRSAADDEGNPVAIETCQVCSPAMIFVNSTRPVLLKLAGTRRWYSDYAVEFNEPRDGDRKRIGDFTIEVDWPRLSVTSSRPVDARAFSRLSAGFSFDLRATVDAREGKAPRRSGRLVRAAGAGWCRCALGPQPGKPEVPMTTTGWIDRDEDAVILPCTNDPAQYHVNEIAKISLTFHKPIEAPFEIEAVVK